MNPNSTPPSASHPGRGESWESRAADRAIAAWRDSQMLEPFTRTEPGFSLADGYAVMQRLHEHRLSQRWVPVGRKIGFTNTTIWERYGVHHPIWGWVYDHTLAAPPASWSEGYACSLKGLVQPRIEPEIVMGFATAPPVTDDLQAVLASVAWIAHGFEIVQSHYPDWRFGAADSVAFGSLHGRLMVGPAVAVRELGADPAEVVRALGSFELTLCRRPDAAGGRWGDAPDAGPDEVDVDRGLGANVLGNPLAAVAHLQALLARERPQDLIQAGEVVTTGTVTDAWAVQPGQTWSTRLQGIGLSGLRVRFED